MILFAGSGVDIVSIPGRAASFQEGNVMLAFLAANWGNIIVMAVLALVIVLIVRNLIGNKKKGKSSCGCGCSNCPSAGMCHKQ